MDITTKYCNRSISNGMNKTKEQAIRRLLMAALTCTICILCSSLQVTSAYATDTWSLNDMLSNMTTTDSDYNSENPANDNYNQNSNANDNSNQAINQNSNQQQLANDNQNADSKNSNSALSFSIDSSSANDKDILYAFVDDTADCLMQPGYTWNKAYVYHDRYSSGTTNISYSAKMLDEMIEYDRNVLKNGGNGLLAIYTQLTVPDDVTDINEYCQSLLNAKVQKLGRNDIVLICMFPNSGVIVAACGEGISNNASAKIDNGNFVADYTDAVGRFEHIGFYKAFQYVINQSDYSETSANDKNAIIKCSYDDALYYVMQMAETILKSDGNADAIQTVMYNNHIVTPQLTDRIDLSNPLFSFTVSSPYKISLYKAAEKGNLHVWGGGDNTLDSLTDDTIEVVDLHFNGQTSTWTAQGITFLLIIGGIILLILLKLVIKIVKSIVHVVSHPTYKTATERVSAEHVDKDFARRVRHSDSSKRRYF